MNRLLTGLILVIHSVNAFAQVVSITPSTAQRNQTLTTTITLATGVMSMASPPMDPSDIYLQQGSTIIYPNSYDPFTNVYDIYGFASDMLDVQFTIPSNAQLGWYSVHVTNYTGMDPFQPWLPPTPIHNELQYGFIVASPNSCPVPSGTSESNITNTSARVNWVTPSVADTFRIRYRIYGTTNYQYRDVQGAGGLTFYVLTGLQPATRYAYDISTICNGESSTYSIADDFTTLASNTNCIVPYNLDTSSVTTSSVILSWTPYVAADTFRIRYSILGTTNYRYLDRNGASGNNALLSSLNYGTTYQAQVSSICNGVSSGYSLPFTFQTKAPACARPVMVTASSITNTSAVIGWSTALTADTFRIRYAVSGTTNYRYRDVTAANSTTLNNLQPATSYDYQASSICNGISSGYSTLQTFSTLGTPVPCVRPWGTSTNNSTNTSIVLSWTPYVTADTFRIRYREISASSYQYLNVNGSGGNSTVLTGLQPNTLYSWQVSAICNGISSGYSNTDNFSTLALPVSCSRPFRLSTSNITSSTTLLSWDNLVTADTFRIRYSVNGTTAYSYINQPGASGSSAVISGLMPNTTYQVQVSSICTGSSSGYSKTITFTTVNGPVACVTPYGLATTNMTGTTADISWTPLVTADSFMIRYSVNGTTNYQWKKISGTSNSTTLTGLSNSTTYQWQVRSICSGVSVSVYSPSDTFTTAPFRVASPALTSMTIYPNPADHLMKAEFNMEREERITIVLIDPSGRKVYETSLVADKGRNEIFIDATGFPSGIYQATILAGDFRESKRVVVLH